MARGSIMSMNTPIMTAMRICIRYCMNAVSEPTSTRPWSTRWPPNQRTAAVARLRMSMMTGNIVTKTRPIFRLSFVRAVLASVKRFDSKSSRPKARTTRMPAICSRSSPLMLSSFCCIFLNSGMSSAAMTATTTASTATATMTSHDIPASWRSAMITPPTAMIGAATMKLKNSSVVICTCCTSLVARVVSVAAPKRDMSSEVKRLTLS